MQRRRDKAAAVKLMHKLLKKQGFAPEVLVTDKLRSYRSAKSEIRALLGLKAKPTGQAALDRPRLGALAPQSRASKRACWRLEGHAQSIRARRPNFRGRAHILDEDSLRRRCHAN